MLAAKTPLYTNVLRATFPMAVLILSVAVLGSQSITSDTGSSAYASASAVASCDNLKIVQTAASTGSGNPKKVIDSNFTSTWSNNGVSAWVRMDLGAQLPICYVDIAWLKGDVRKNSFTIYASNDTSASFTKVYSGQSSGKTNNFERYDFADVNARYLKVSVTKNQISSWVGISEIDVYGQTIQAPIVPSSKYLFALVKDSYGDQQGLTDFYKLHTRNGDLSRSKPSDSNLQYTMQLPGTHGVSYFSLAEIKDNAPKLKAKGVDFVEYDLESDYSPASDMADPVASVKAAAGVVHANGLKFVLDPSKAITRDYVVQMAPYADYYNLMFQALQGEGCTTDYRSYVEDISGKIRIVNPNAKISIEVSTNRGTLENMEECYKAGAEFAEGVSIWYSNDDQGIAELKGFVEWFDANYR